MFTRNRILAIIAIYLLAAMGWMILGMVTELRSDTMAGRLDEQVRLLWGTPLVQRAPSFTVDIPGTDKVRRVLASVNDIAVKIDLEYRRKGLIWYPTYLCRFDGRYTITNAEAAAQKVRFHFDFPAPGATYDNFNVLLDDKRLEIPIDTRRGVGDIVELAPAQSRTFRITYRTRGLYHWRYRLDRHLGRVRNLDLRVATNFKGVDYPEGGLSPMTAIEVGDGMDLTWKARDLITSQDIGLTVPERINPGPLASRITFFAPICLIFFFTLIGAITVVYRVDIHPMHYLFVAAGFFAFHILLVYLVDHVNVHAAFAISALTSVALTTSYLTTALGKQLPRAITIGGQSFFLVLFSYSFFIEGATGLTVAIGSVLTLAVLMRVTIHTDWSDVFAGRESAV